MADVINLARHKALLRVLETGKFPDGASQQELGDLMSDLAKLLGQNDPNADLGQAMPRKR
jgi:hypothetical protein